MGGQDDRQWRELNRQRDTNEPRARDEATAGPDTRHLRPNNEGHDEERQRKRLEDWAGEEGGHGRDARALAEIEGRSAVAEGTVEVEQATRHHAEDHSHRIGGGEPKKHPRKPEETTPEPGKGPSSHAGLPGEPPRVEVGPAGETQYVHGRELRPKSNQGT